MQDVDDSDPSDDETEDGGSLHSEEEEEEDEEEEETSAMRAAMALPGWTVIRRTSRAGMISRSISRACSM